jgi:hypothetical protein
MDKLPVELCNEIWKFVGPHPLAAIVRGLPVHFQFWDCAADVLKILRRKRQKRKATRFYQREYLFV